MLVYFCWFPIYPITICIHIYLNGILSLSWAEEGSSLTEKNAWVFQEPLVGY